jgi:hypothetical protein
MREVQKEKENIEKKEEKYFRKTMKSAGDLRETKENISKKENDHDIKDGSSKNVRSTDELREGMKESKNFRKIEEDIQKYDPHAKEIEQEANEGWKRPESGADRSEFGRQDGQYEHKRWQDEVSETEIKAGRQRGIDFETEKVFKHPDGGEVRLDYVNYRTDVIIDRKPVRLSENKEELINKYENQRKRHIEAYEYSTGHKVLHYDYSLYPSTNQLWSDDQNKK